MDATVPVTATSAKRGVDPPGPFYWEPFSGARAMLRDPLGCLERDWHTYGDIGCVRVGPLRHYFVIHPDHVQHVLQERNRNYVKGPIIARTKVLIGEGLFTSEGDFWRRQRRLAQPAFHRARIAAFADMMTACGRDMLDSWAGAAASGTTFDLAAETSRVTLRVVGKALFSLDLQGEAASVGQALVEALDFVTHRTFNLLVPSMWVPTGRIRRFRRALAVLDDMVLRIVHERRRASDPSAAQDLLGMLIAARDEETGEGMTDRQLRDEVMTFVLAGHETTAVSLAWIWYLLARHPAVEHRLRDEVATTLGGRTPTLDDLPRLPYARMVVEESMRLYPPLWAFGRQALEEDQIGGYRIAAGAPLNVIPWLTHRHPDFWPDPGCFDPERFAPERAAARHRFAYLPFSGGPRLCIGSEFALMEAVLLLAMTVQRYRIALADPERPIVPDVKVTLRPRGGIPVRIRPA
jgi:cytochrome P450